MHMNLSPTRLDLRDKSTEINMMMRQDWKRQHRIYQQGTTMALVGTLLLSSCAAAPFLIPIAFEFARNLFQTGLSELRIETSRQPQQPRESHGQSLHAKSSAWPGMPSTGISPGNRGFKASRACRNNNIPGNRPIQGKPAPTTRIIPMDSRSPESIRAARLSLWNDPRLCRATGHAATTISRATGLSRASRRL